MTFSCHFNFLFFDAPMGLRRNSAVNVRENRRTERLKWPMHAIKCYLILGRCSFAMSYTAFADIRHSYLYRKGM